MRARISLGMTPADVLRGLNMDRETRGAAGRFLLRWLHNGPAQLCSDGKVRWRKDGQDD